MKVSKAFETFASEVPEVQKIWMEMVGKLDKASNLDKKTEEIAYLAVLSSNGMLSGISFHVKMAKLNGASREEIISAILVGLPAVGHNVIQALPVALEAYDE